MSRKRLIIFFFVMISVLICGCLGEGNIVTADMRGGEISAASVDLPKPNPIDEALRSMTLEEKIGQMMMVGFYGTELNDDIKYLLSTFHFGGVIFFDRNLLDVAQAKKLSDDIQTFAGQKYPLLIALDEEGGRVARGRDFLPPAPSQEEVGISGDTSAATYWARYNAGLLRSVGVNINFAPVADVGSRDTRSFGDNAQTVAEFVEAAAQGYESENFLYTLKHFPGIGRSKIDPHKAVSSVEVGRDVLEAEDFLPFRKIISGHDDSKFMIMVGHLKYDALDAENSASLSRAVMTELLRGDMGFDGVVVTDDLEMGAIKNNVELSTLGVKTILAGGDIALVCHNYESQQIVYDGILSAVRRGEISESRIDESVRRILKLKSHLN